MMIMMMTKIEKTSLRIYIDVEHGVYVAVTPLKNQILSVDIKNKKRKTVMRIYFLNMGCT